jgi:hypothetical protein
MAIRPKAECCERFKLISGQGFSQSVAQNKELGLYELNLETDCDFHTNKNATGLERSVPGQAEVLAVDLCARRDRNPGVAPWVLRRWRWPFHHETDLSGNAVYGQVAFDGQLSVPHNPDVRGFKVQARKFLHIEEIGALKVSIALLIAGVNGGNIDDGFDTRVRQVSFIQKQGSRNL